MPSTKTSPHKAGDKRYRLHCPDGYETEPMTYAQAVARVQSLQAGRGTKGICPHEHTVIELDT